MLSRYGDRSDQRRVLVRLRAAASDDVTSLASDDECLPVIVHAGNGKIVGDQQLFDRLDVRFSRRVDEKLHASRITKRPRSPRGLHYEENCWLVLARRVASALAIDLITAEVAVFFNVTGTARAAAFALHV